MTLSGPRHTLIPRWLTLLAVAACFGLAADSAWAQAGGGMVRGGGGRKPKDQKQQPRQPDKPAPQTPGLQTGRIIKFKPAKESDAEKGVAGYLSVKPFEKNGKLLKLTVFKETDEGKGGVVIKLGDHTFEDVEDFGDLFWKGLYVTAGWGYKGDNEKSKVKELRTVDFNPIEVKGKVESIADDILTIRVTPKNGQDWPHLAALNENKNTKAGITPKPKPIRQLKVKLKVIEDVSKLLDADGEEASLSSFEPGQAIEASIVFSQNIGMIVKIGPPGVDGSAVAPPTEPPDGGTPPGPRGGPPRGRRPRGG